MIHNNPNNSRTSSKNYKNTKLRFKSYSLAKFYNLKKYENTKYNLLDAVFILAGFTSLICFYFTIKEFMNLRNKLTEVLGDGITIMTFFLEFHKYKDVNFYSNYYLKNILRRKMKYIAQDVQTVCVIDSGSRIGNILKYIFSFDILFSCSKSVTQQSITRLISSSKRELMQFIDGILYSIYHIQRLSIRTFTLGNSSLIYLIFRKRQIKRKSLIDNK